MTIKEMISERRDEINRSLVGFMWVCLTMLGMVVIPWCVGALLISVPWGRAHFPAVFAIVVLVEVVVFCLGLRWGDALVAELNAEAADTAEAVAQV